MTNGPRLALALLVVLSFSSVSRADFISMIAYLDGPSEFPPNASSGTGFAKVELDTTAHLLHVHVEFTDLVGTTTAAHIHAPTAVPGTGTAPVATMLPSFLGFPLGVTSGTFDATFDTSISLTFNPAYVTANGGTVAGAEAALFAAMKDGTAYFNIHTTLFPGGEIRGFLDPVPEPSTFILLGTGLATLVVTRGQRPKVAGRVPARPSRA